ncbi:MULTISPECIES: STAS domain-containing protein [unclassified Streptomyces]|uniref:STAS domain-containing protein n=1 Tax=unclassified Streptomyces TaxID=2593676 RepID=UPI00381A849B
MSPLADRGPHSVTVVTGVDRSVVTVTGDMDLDHVDALNSALLGACADPGAPQRVVVDLTRLAFCDSAGLNALLRARALCESNGRTLILAGPGPQFMRLLSITGADLLFNLGVPGPGDAGDGTARATP